VVSGEWSGECVSDQKARIVYGYLKNDRHKISEFLNAIPSKESIDQTKCNVHNASGLSRTTSLWEQ
jgi:hypothetical protein